MLTRDFLKKLEARIHKVDTRELKKYISLLIKEKYAFADVLDHVTEAIVILNTDLESVFYNKKAEIVLGLPASHKRLPLSDTFQDAVFQKEIIQAINEKREVYQQDITLLQPRPMILKWTLLKTEFFDESANLVLVENISRSEMVIREHFQKANWETMISLAAGIAHELGNPLNSISIHLQLLEQNSERLESKEKKEVTKSLRVLKAETNRLDQIIRNFLKATRKRLPQFEKENVNDLIRQTTELFAPELHRNNVHLELDLAEDMPKFLIDRDRLQQAFINLLKNSIQAMPRGGSMCVRSDFRDKICFLEFEDTGTGIDEKDLPHIFDAYYSSKDEGTGLGLMIVHQIIVEHQGRIEVASRLGKGTKITLILPMRKEKLSLPNLKDEESRRS